MSLETLLEAAKYLEYRSEATARGETPEDFLSFLNLGGNNSGNNNNNNNNNSRNNYFSQAISTSNCESIKYGNHQYHRTTDNEARERRRTSGSGTREVHNKLEKNRRAHLKKCFETLRKQIPNIDEKKTSNLSILRSSLKYIQVLKRKEREYEHESDRLAREKGSLQRRLMSLKEELSSHLDHIDINCLLPDPENETNSTSTASECGPLSDDEDFDRDVLAKPTACDERTTIEQLSVIPDGIQQSAHSASSLPAGATATSAQTITPSAAKWFKAQWLNPKLGNSSRAIVPNLPPQIQQPQNPLISGPTVVTTSSTKERTTALPFGNIPSRIQVAPFGSFPTQILPQGTDLVQNGSVLTTHSTVQVLAQPSVGMRFITASSKPTTSTTATLLPSSTRVLNPVQLKAALSSSLPLPSQMAGRQSNVKGVLTPANPQGQIAIPVANFAIESNNTLTISPLNFQTAASNPVSSVNGPSSVVQHFVPSTVTQVRASSLTQIAHVVAPTTLVSSLGTPVTVMPSLGHVLAPSQIGKVVATSPFLKSVSQIPIVQQQFVPQLVKPLVMVTSSANILNPESLPGTTK